MSSKGLLRTSLAGATSAPSHEVATNSVDSDDDPFYRLHHTPKRVPKPKVDEANVALVSDLPTHTLKWIKKRRSVDTERKVVLSPQAEKQLREMFNSLDINHTGTISLAELTEAIEYVQDKTKGAKGLEAFQNIASVFAAMDDNGDGTIDFTEFTNGMTGTANSAFERASPHDIEKLFSYFVEFGERKQREHAVRRINEAMGLSPTPVASTSAAHIANGNSSPTESTPSPQRKHPPSQTHHGHPHEAPSFIGDTSSYQSFKALFGNEDSSAKAKSDAIRQNQELAARKAKHIESLLEEFLSQPVEMDSEGKDRQSAENKLLELRKRHIEAQYGDPSMVALVHHLSEKRKVEQTRRSHLLPSLGETSRGDGPVRRPSSLLVRDEQGLRLNAQKEAYDTLRNGLTADENDHLRATAQAVMRSRGVGEPHSPATAAARLGPLRTSQLSSLRASYSSPSISLSPTRASLSLPVRTPMTGASSKSGSRPTSRPAQLSRSSLCFGPVS